MKIFKIYSPLRVASKRFTLATVLAASLGGSSMQAQSTVVWDLEGDGAWDLATQNWSVQGSVLATTFANGDTAVFDKAAGGSIAIAPGISALSTTVSGTGDYTFTGGPLTSGDLNVSGPGALNLSAANTYTGPITGGGTVRRDLGGGVNQALNYDLSAFTGTLEISNGMAAANPFYSASFDSPTDGSIRIVDNTTLYLGWQGTTFDTTILLDGSVDRGGFGVLRGDTATLDGAVVLGANSSIGSAGGTFTINAVISDEQAGYGFTKVATGVVVLTAANTYSGATNVAAGTLQCDSPDALGSGGLSISSGGATLNLNYSGTKTIPSLILGGVEATDPGTYGSLTSDAVFKSTFFEGAGTVSIGNAGTTAFISGFGTNIPEGNAIIGSIADNVAAITWVLPFGTDLATLAPTFELSEGATVSDQTSGVIPSPNFSAGPVDYTVVSGDTLITNVYSVTATVLTDDTTLIWNLATGGDWDLTTPNWLGQTSASTTPFSDGKNVIFDQAGGGTITIETNIAPLTTTVSGTGAYSFTGGPLASGDLTVSAPATLNLAAGDTYGGSISGDGTVFRNLGGRANDRVNYDLSAFTGTLEISNGMAATNPFYSSSFVSPAGGSIRIVDNTTLYLGWQNMTVNTTILLDGTFDNGEGFGVLRGDAATLNGAVVLGTNSSIGAAGGIFTINAEISDGGLNYGFTKVANGTVVLTAANTYTGATNVAAGTLELSNPDALGSGDLIISSGGATVNINFVGTKIINSLTLGDTPVSASGTYGSTASDADFQDDTYFAGTGTVTFGDASTYDGWVSRVFPSGLTLTDTTPSLDFDGGGMQTGIEWVTGGDPTDSSDDAALAPTVSEDETYVSFTYLRTDAAAADANTTIAAEYGSDLVGWTAAEDLIDGVVIVVTDGDPADTVEVRIPKSLAAPESKLFVRLNVNVAAD